MKKLMMLLIAVSASIEIASAQDILTKKDGSNLNIKVLEVGTNEIKYKIYGESEGPTYTLKKSEIQTITYESGRSESFSNPIQNGIVPGMKYKQLKKIYSPKDYIDYGDSKYSVGWSGVASFLVPGLGQVLVDEVGKGIGYFIGSWGMMAMGTVFANATDRVLTNGTYVEVLPTGFAVTALCLYAGALALDISSISNAVKTAKVKNMYYNDLRKNYSVNVDLYPSVNLAHVNGGNTLATGVTLAVRF